MKDKLLNALQQFFSLQIVKKLYSLPYLFKIVLFIIIIIACSIGFYYSSVVPVKKELSDNVKKENYIKESISTNILTYKQFQLLQKDLDSVQKNYQDMFLRLPKKELRSDFLTEFSAFIIKSGVSIVRLTPLSKDIDSSTGFYTTKFALDVTGDFKQITTLFTSFITMDDRLVRFINVRLSIKGGSSKILSLSADIVVYSRGVNNE